MISVQDSGLVGNIYIHILERVKIKRFSYWKGLVTSTGRGWCAGQGRWVGCWTGSRWPSGRRATSGWPWSVWRGSCCSRDPAACTAPPTEVAPIPNWRIASAISTASIAVRRSTPPARKARSKTLFAFGAIFVYRTLMYSRIAEDYENWKSIEKKKTGIHCYIQTKQSVPSFFAVDRSI